MGCVDVIKSQAVELECLDTVAEIVEPVVVDNHQSITCFSFATFVTASGLSNKVLMGCFFDDVHDYCTGTAIWHGILTPRTCRTGNMKDGFEELLLQQVLSGVSDA